VRGDFTVLLRICDNLVSDAGGVVAARARGPRPFRNMADRGGKVSVLMGSLIKKRRKRMRKKKHKKMLKRTRFQRRAKGK
jgi:hypothetical protein